MRKTGNLLSLLPNLKYEHVHLTCSPDIFIQNEGRLDCTGYDQSLCNSPLLAPWNSCMLGLSCVLQHLPLTRKKVLKSILADPLAQKHLYIGHRINVWRSKGKNNCVMHDCDVPVIFKPSSVSELSIIFFYWVFVSQGFP